MFMHAWAIGITAAAVGLPVLIHWLTQPRPTRVPLSTWRFVREVIEQRRTRSRLRDWLILALRMAAIVLICLAMARPRNSSQPLVARDDAGDTLRVVVLDASQSLGAVVEGAELFQRARTVALDYLRYRPGLRANLIVAGERPRGVFKAPSQNFEALRDALDHSTILPERLDIQRAIASAGEMLTPGSADDKQRRELVIVSDFQRGNWTRADFTSLPAETALHLESVAVNEKTDNLAVIGVKVAGRTTTSRTSQLAVEIGNYSAAAHKVEAEATWNGGAIHFEGVCPAGRRTTLTQDIRFDHPGWHFGEVKLVGVTDALLDDNRRPFAVEVGDTPVYSLVTREPANRRPSASHFLECALAPDATRKQTSAARVVRCDPAALERQDLTSSDLIVVDHPGTLTPEALSLLGSLLRRGRPILYCAADAVDAINLRLLATNAGNSLALPVEFAPLPAGQPRNEAFVVTLRNNLAPFQVLGDAALAALRPVKFAGGLSTRRVPGGLEEDLLATYNDGAACLVMTSSDAGTLAVWNADLGRSALPRTELFVPLLDDLVSRLLERGTGGASAVCGRPVVVRFRDSGKSSELNILSPEGQIATPADNDTLRGQVSDDGAGAVWQSPGFSRPGVYRLERASKTVYALPVGIDEEESQLESLSAEVLTERLGAGRNVSFHSITHPEETRDTMWVWLAIGCVLCLGAELCSLMAFRS